MALEGAQFSHYRILHPVGKGGMGEVYLLEDQRVQRQVAGKFIRLDVVQADRETAEQALRLFWREATAIAQLDHPAILPLYDHGEVTIEGTAVAYLIMPYRPAGSLKDWLRQREREERPLNLLQVAHIIQQAAQGLQHAHEHGIMHLDVKPANFLLRTSQPSNAYPDLLLSDFGIARLVNASSHTSQQVRGTPAYMAPEQWANRAVFASDQYALAIMAYELLAGHPPFQGAPMSVMYAHTRKRPPAISDAHPQVPATVDLVLQRALAKRPEQRFASVAAFAHALQEAIQGGDTTTALREPRPASRDAIILPDGQSPVHSRGDSLRAPWDSPHASSRHVTISRNVTPMSIRNIILALLTLLMLGAGSFGLYRVTHNQPQTAGNPGATVPFHQQTPSATTSPAATAQPDPNALGQTWHIQTNPSPATNGTRPFLYSVAWADGRFVAVGGSGTILTSFDGISWNAQTVSTPQILYGVAWSGKRFAIVGTGGTIFTSLDGINWIPQNSNVLQDLYGIIWTGKHFVAVGQSGTILTSTDGITWNAQNAGTTQSLQAIAWSGKTLVAVGTSNAILTSTDSINWTVRTTRSSRDFYDVTWSGSLFMAVGPFATILTSSDGILWNDQNAGVQQDLHSVVWAGSGFVIAGTNGTILTSPDGTHWSIQTPITAQFLYGVAWSGTRLVAVGQFGVILSSP